MSGAENSCWGLIALCAIWRAGGEDPATNGKRGREKKAKAQCA